MAEFVGLVASGISIGTLAAQITSSLVKLKSYWDQIQDAPEDIRDVLEELEDLSLILADIENDQRLNPFSSTMMGSTSQPLQQCKQAAECLKTLIESVQTDIEVNNKLRRKWASTKIVVKKDQIGRYRSKLERALRLLSLAHQVYMRDLLQRQPDVIVAKLSQSTMLSSATSPTNVNLEGESPLHAVAESSEAIPSPGTCKEISSYIARPWTLSGLFGSLYYSRRRYSKITYRRDSMFSRKESREEIVARYRSPAWFINQEWQIKATRDLSGWTIRPGTFNIIPATSEVFKLAECDNVEGLRELFCEGKASPFDCDEYGWSVLHYAVEAAAYSTCKLLIEQGADVDHETDFGDTTISSIFWYPRSPPQKILDIIRILLCESSVDHDPREFVNSKEVFELYLSYLDPDHYARPLEERVEMALRGFCHPVDADLLRLVVTRGSIPEEATTISNSKGWTLLHVVAYYFVDCRELYYLHDMTAFRALLGELIRKGSNIHHITEESETPLAILLDKLFHFCPPKSDNVATFYMWLQGLDAWGVDLLEYGRTETELHERGLVSWEFLDRYWFPEDIDDDLGWVLDEDLKELYYGESPGDWGFYVESFVYKPVKRQDRRVPGAWTEDDSRLIEGNEGDKGQERDFYDTDEEVEFQGANNAYHCIAGKHIVGTEVFDIPSAGGSRRESTVLVPCDLGDLTKRIKYVFRQQP